MQKKKNHKLRCADFFEEKISTSSHQRLSKVLSGAGIASRRKAEDLIFSGRVAVNGAVCTLPQTMIDPAKDEISVNGKKIECPDKCIYYLLNKPKGFLCTHERRSKRNRLIYDLFPTLPNRLFSAGRLDKETEGLIIITNDGAFANKIIHPSSQLSKEYIAKTNHEITDVHLIRISKGIEIEGVKVIPHSVQKVRKGTVKIVVKEGKKHEVRLLLDAAGLTVYHLKRTRIGGLRLGDLALGKWREMTVKERERIFK